jgi:hypothetical protein
MGLRSRVKQSTIVTGLTMLFVCSIGCSQAAMLTHETENGGVATYLFKEDRGGPMGSPYRRAAMQLIEKKCPSGYTVLKDGEMQGYSSLSTSEGSEGDASGRRWGIQFRCKGV